MEIQSTRFGLIEVNDERIIHMPRGLLGFPNHTRFALIQTGEENYFFWLQSIDEAGLAFVVTDPTIFFKDYDVPLRDETKAELKMSDPSFGQVFCICNRIDEWLTGNLLGPIIVNAENRLAVQIVLTEKKWTTRQPLLRLQQEMPVGQKRADRIDLAGEIRSSCHASCPSRSCDAIGSWLGEGRGGQGPPAKRRETAS